MSQKVLITFKLLNMILIDTVEVELGSHRFQVEHEVSKFWKLEAHKLGVQSTGVKGQLKKSLFFWRDVLLAPPPVLECIDCSYCLPPYSQSNHKSAISHQQFVSDAVQSLRTYESLCCKSY